MTMQTREISESVGFGREVVVGDEATRLETANTSVQAEAAYFQALEPLRLFSVACFWAAGTVAAFAPGKLALLLVALMVVASLAAGLARIVAMKKFRRETERQALAEGVSRERARQRAALAQEPGET